MRKEIRLAGFGGQGVVLAGYILGKAASIYDNKHSVLTRSYGPEARGGECTADVVIANHQIDYPVVSEPDVVVAMSQAAYEKYGRAVSSKCKAVVEEDLVNFGRSKVNSVPATRIAEQLGNRICANIVMLGYLTKVARIVSAGAMRKSIRGTVPKGSEALNLKAFEKGYEYEG